MNVILLLNSEVQIIYNVISWLCKHYDPFLRRFRRLLVAFGLLHRLRMLLRFHDASQLGRLQDSVDAFLECRWQRIQHPVGHRERGLSPLMLAFDTLDVLTNDWAAVAGRSFAGHVRAFVVEMRLACGMKYSQMFYRLNNQVLCRIVTGNYDCRVFHVKHIFTQFVKLHVFLFISVCFL